MKFKCLHQLFFIYCCGCFSFHVFCVKTSVQGALSSAVPLRSLCSSWLAATLPMLWCQLLAWVPEACVWWTTSRSCPCCKLIWPSTVLQRLQPAVFCSLTSCWRTVSDLLSPVCLPQLLLLFFFCVCLILSFSHLFLLSTSSLARTSCWVLAEPKLQSSEKIFFSLSLFHYLPRLPSDQRVQAFGSQFSPLVTGLCFNWFCANAFVSRVSFWRFSEIIMSTLLGFLSFCLLS